MNAAGCLSLCNEAKFKKYQSIRRGLKLCLYIPSRETSSGCCLFRTRFFMIICKLPTVAPHFTVLLAAQICRIFYALVSRHAMPTHTSGNRLDAYHAFRYWYRHDLCLSARASCSHYCQPMTARSPRPFHVRRSCLHNLLFTALRRFLWSFSNCALFWWFVVRSGDCVRMVGTRSGCPLCPPVAPGGGFTLTHFRTTAHAQKPPPAPPRGGSLQSFFRGYFPFIFARFRGVRISPLSLRFFSALLVLG